MTKSEKQLWEQKRAKGEAHFVLCEGLLRRGLPFAVIVTGVSLLCDTFTHHPIEPTLKLTIMFAFYTVGFGGLIGATNWRDHERDYQKPTDDDNVA